MRSPQEIDQEIVQLDKLRQKDKFFDYGLKIAMVIGFLGVIFAPTLDQKLLLGMFSLGSAGVSTAPRAHEALKKIFPPKS